MRVKEQAKLRFRAWKYRLDEDPAEIAYLLRRVKKGQIVFDIGAHKGGYTYWLQKAVGTSGKVCAFEPQKSGAVLLESLFSADNVRVEKLALSYKEGVQDFFIQPQANSVSFEASIANKYVDAQMVRVQTTTLDAYCRQQSLRPSFLKIDVEGHELEVLEGGNELLSKHKPALLIEVEERHIGREKMEAIFGMLSHFRYKGFFFYKGVQQPLANFDSSIHQSLADLKRSRNLYCNNFVFEPNV
jgi:FkbM family methyltransferase